MATDPALCSATDLVAGFRAGTLSPVDATRATLARIDALDPVLNAFCFLDRDGAMAAARASEARWARRAPLGPLDGVPVSIKDLILVRDWPTLRGSRTIDPAGPWPDDAPAVARLRESGAVLLGKTTTPEMGWKGVTDGPLTGVTRNPWNTALTPGGSSGGAAAQLAAGMGALAVGTDGGGSIRIPCAFSGLSGIKANFGRVPAWPLSPMGTVAHVGPMARTVADCALLLGVIARPDPRDWFAAPAPAVDWTASVSKGVRGLRVAYSPRLGYVPHVDPEIEAAVEAAVGVLARQGATVTHVDPGFADCEPMFSVIWKVGAYNALKGLPEAKRALLEPGLQQAYEIGARTSLAAWLDANNARIRLGEHMNRFHRDHDVLVTPTLPIAAFATGRVSPPGGPSEDDWTWWTPFTFPFNLTQQPAMSVPCGLTAGGLPIGMQIVGPNFREDLVFAVAGAYQDATDHHLAVPLAPRPAR
jgi:aspartyl-tRNA(Asn)/glutamyl-tRNA(Gln) amidotransferase subunit A